MSTFRTGETSNTKALYYNVLAMSKLLAIVKNTTYHSPVASKATKFRAFVCLIAFAVLL